MQYKESETPIPGRQRVGFKNSREIRLAGDSLKEENNEVTNAHRKTIHRKHANVTECGETGLQKMMKDCRPNCVKTDIQNICKTTKFNCFTELSNCAPNLPAEEI